MKIDIEVWLSQQKFKKSTEELYEEAIMAYKVGAYKAAYTFSYLAFLHEVKLRILASDKPSSIPQPRWDNIIKGLQNDDKWDETLLTELNNNTTSIFNITEDMRNQVIFWKNRRNDCVHFKSSLITASLVESFWNFVKVFLPRFVVKESIFSLENKIIDNFDLSKTPRGTDYDDLIKSIHTSVNLTEYKAFFDKLLDEIEMEDLIPFIDKCLTIADINIIEFLNQYLVKESKEVKVFLFGLIRFNQQRILLIKNDHKRIRKFWHSGNLFRDGYNDFSLFAFMLRSEVIPSSEVNESIEKIIDNITDSNLSIIPNQEDMIFLEVFNYNEILKQKVISFKKKDMAWFNDHSHALKGFLLYIKLDSEIVEAINFILINKNPWGLNNRFSEIFYKYPDYKENINKIALESGIKLCHFLSKD